MIVSAEEQVKTVLLDDPGVMALVDGRLFADEVPERLRVGAEKGDASCALTYERGATAPEYTLDNTLAAARVTIVVMVFARTRALANELATAVSLAMLVAAHVETDRQSTYDPSTRLYGASMFFDVWEA